MEWRVAEASQRDLAVIAGQGPICQCRSGSIGPVLPQLRIGRGPGTPPMGMVLVSQALRQGGGADHEPGPV